ncbi:flavin reductase family protein [Sphingomonas sp. HDW15A]|uniref:flavin reductase family protein n=1 Tax=Sphingomonas sp. HDW15A TaxID=2714942 RepID=UPI00140AB4DC|nr:flavin reductase family protein [Sphingomonas sp. HDW15A]QIK95686.1 flavin reductase family protein [Sphingomonas sp. HDW15A]
MTAIDPQSFRQALGTFVTGVTIVTARAPDGQPIGLTVSSFNSVSLDPPLVLWSLALKSASLPSFREARSWAVHVLSVGQEEISARFATPGADRFAGLEFEDGPEGAPQLPEFAARFGCEATFEYEGGDHAIFVGHVENLQRRDAEPLVYHGGRYGRVRQPADDLGQPALKRLADTGFLELVPGGFQLTEIGRAMLGDLRAGLARWKEGPGLNIPEGDRRLLADLHRLIEIQSAS